MLTTKPPHAVSERREDDVELFSSRKSYVISGAGLGLVEGLLAMGQANGGTAPLWAVALAATIGGAAVGLELHVTRGWAQAGRWANLGRWVLAFVSAGVTVGGPLLWLGAVDRFEYYAILGFSAVLGLGYGMESIRYNQQRRALEAKSAKEAASTDAPTA